MKGAIVSIEKRSAGNILIFDVDETNYSPEASRVITKDTALDGTVLTTNWGYSQGSRTISLGNIILSQTDYDILIAMKEDNNYDFLFGYLDNLWAVVIRGVSGNQERERRAEIDLSVISKYSDMEIV